MKKNPMTEKKTDVINFDFVNSRSKKTFLKNDSSIDVQSNEVLSFCNGQFNINPSTIDKKQLEFLIDIHRKGLEEDKDIETEDKENKEESVSVFSHNNNTETIHDNNANHQYVQKKIYNDYVLPSLTMLHTPPYHEQAYLWAAVSARKPASVSCLKFDKNEKSYYMKTAAINMEAIGYVSSDSDTDSKY